jgi:hypothetical protein
VSDLHVRLDAAAAFDAAVHELERAVADLPWIGRVDGCPVCWSAEQLQALGGDPRRVPDDWVRQFAAEIPSHWIEAQYTIMWRTYAPRMLRLLAASPASHLVNMTIRGVGSREARFDRWPAAHQDAILQALRALLVVAVLSWHPVETTELLEGLAYLHDDLGPWLAVIDELGPEADEAVARLIETWAGDDLRIFWLWAPEHVEPSAVLRSWLASEPVQARRSSRTAR